MDMRPTALRIKSRCWDFLRAKRRKSEEQFADEPDLMPMELSYKSPQVLDRTEELNEIIQRTQLTPKEKVVLYKLFYDNQTLKTASQELGITQEELETQLSQTLFKLNQTKEALDVVKRGFVEDV